MFVLVALSCRTVRFDLYQDFGLWNSTVISTLIGMIILIMLHHVQLKFSNPFVVVKEAVDWWHTLQAVFLQSHYKDVF